MKHNRLDFACSRWIGDMNPRRGDLVNTELDGRFTSITDRRCVICRPFTRTEADALLDVDLFAVCR